MAKTTKPLSGRAKPPSARDPIKAAKAVGPLLGAMMVGGIPGLPAQIRDTAREAQRPPAFVPPKKAKRGKRR